MKFLRADTFRLKRLGSHRKKLQKWRRPRGKHNKIRLKRAGHPKQPGIGYGKERKIKGKINGMTPILVRNVDEISKLKKGEIAIIGRVGAKKKIEMLKKAEILGIPILNAGGKK